MLTGEKAETVKIVRHAVEKKEEVSVPVPAPPPKQQQQQSVRSNIVVPVPVTHSPEAKARAKATRDAEVRQLETRLGRLPQFSKSRDGIEFVVPIQPAKKAALPLELQAVKTVRLIVPELYDLQPCRVKLVGVSGEGVGNVERGFAERAAGGQKEASSSLLGQLNYLAQNMHVMAKASKVEVKPTTTPAATSQVAKIVEEKPQVETKQSTQVPGDSLDRPHVVTIPRPPEWRTPGENDESESESSSSSDEASSDEANDPHSSETASAPQAGTTSVEKGILMSFPHLELHGVELLEIGVLNLTVKCDRCKDVKDVGGLRNNSVEGEDHTRRDSCKKCASPFVLGYRAEFLHANSTRAGYLDLDGCTVVDMLPSSFIPTCAECSTMHPRNGVTAVRGDTSMAFCRECHRKMTFGLPEIKFLRVSARTERASHAPVRKKRAENLGIVAGQELPNRGRCTHYRKSYRWFRFSCCSKVFPCDRCHDQTADHAIEHANRMICGFCSREQNYRPNDCGICHAWLTMKPGKGFWEGGTGTRDRTKMSRKDPRKYKRIGGSSANKS
ncbi:zf-CHY-domain-containing protein [Aaosphaeria arxii CBS 175.79]|uniref:Zf-CHY-domain-containing protein n=1 Tax=Aaosphaeria arxii CBS 175.79 TaxID=1450172 RepID=A0A6A5X8W2_9PLEO|nr:zf-CHY-domain-containing protein [Aaosphaeria arxii CBS 175.79]KAF2009505.1 zf-CHY-domain-containing protein [Aaosphaeria arxii CBS 175.79]